MFWINAEWQILRIEYSGAFQYICFELSVTGEDPKNMGSRVRGLRASCICWGFSCELCDLPFYLGLNRSKEPPKVSVDLL